MRKSPIKRASEKALASGELLWNSTIKRTPRKPKTFTPSVLDGLKPYTAMPRRSSSLPKPKKAIRKRNPERAAKRDKQYAAWLRRYHASATAIIVAARAAGRCEFSVAVDASVIPRVLDIRLDRERPEGYVRCNRRMRVLQHHHTSYARFGGAELPEDMLMGCPGCHEYVESMKAAHRHRRSAPDGGLAPLPSQEPDNG